MTKKQQKYYFDLKIKIAWALFFLNALIWVGLGIYLVFEMAGFDNRLSAAIISIFMLGNAAAMFVSGLVIYKRLKWGYFFAVAVLGINIILTFTDQVGLIDFLTLLVDIVLLMIVISLSNLYFAKT